MIKLVRIDHRLLHGQVVFSWSKSLNINRIIIANKEAANDEFKKMSLNLSKPTGIKLTIFSVEQKKFVNFVKPILKYKKSTMEG